MERPTLVSFLLELIALNSWTIDIHLINLESGRSTKENSSILPSRKSNIFKITEARLVLKISGSVKSEKTHNLPWYRA